MNKYLLLDIDGVLNSERTVAAYEKMTHCGRVKHDLMVGIPADPMFDHIAVGMLKTAQRLIGFDIIISSTWRSVLSLEQFHSVFDVYGWDTRNIIKGKTGYEPGCRGDQIKAWLDANATGEYRYCIIDDSADMLESQLPNFVQTDAKNGLDFDAYMKIFSIMGVDYEALVGL